jgi:hypothetical protein
MVWERLSAFKKTACMPAILPPLLAHLVPPIPPIPLLPAPPPPPLLLLLPPLVLLLLLLLSWL